jgi:hypothetical protein
LLHRAGEKYAGGDRLAKEKEEVNRTAGDKKEEKKR